MVMTIKMMLMIVMIVTTLLLKMIMMMMMMKMMMPCTLRIANEDTVPSSSVFVVISPSSSNADGGDV